MLYTRVVSVVSVFAVTVVAGLPATGARMM
jgi:hypothetical protein